MHSAVPHEISAVVRRERALCALHSRRRAGSLRVARFNWLHCERRCLIALIVCARLHCLERRLDVMPDLLAMHDHHMLIKVALYAQQNVLFEVEQLRDMLAVLPLQILHRLIALGYQQRFQKRNSCHDREPGEI